MEEGALVSWDQIEFFVCWKNALLSRSDNRDISYFCFQYEMKALVWQNI